MFAIVFVGDAAVLSKNYIYFYLKGTVTQRQRETETEGDWVFLSTGSLHKWSKLQDLQAWARLRPRYKNSI